MATSAFFPEKWASVAQELHKPMAIYRQLANFRAEPEMKFGDVYHRVIPGDPYIQPVTRGTDLDQQSTDGTDQSMSINNQYGFLVGVEEFDEVQSSVPLMATYLKNAMRNLSNVIDSSFLYEVLNATSSLDAGNFGGTSGVGVTLSGSNVFDAMAKVKQKLSEQNIDHTNLYGVIDPATAFVIESQLGARETAMGDQVSRNGYDGNMLRYGGMDLYVTNNYTQSIELDLATNPTNGDTVTFTVGGTAITFTFVSVIGTTAGNVLIGANVDATRGNLETLINAPDTTTANGVAFSAGATLRLLQTSCVAVNDDSANTLTFYTKGKSLSGSETLTDATDGFDATEASAYLMFGQKGAVDMVNQVAPRFKKREEPRRETVNLLGTSLWGQKTYTDGAQKLVNLRVLVS